MTHTPKKLNKKEQKRCDIQLYCCKKHAQVLSGDTERLERYLSMDSLAGLHINCL